MKKWAILGGDRRQIAMLERLLEKEIPVSAWGIGEASTESDWKSAIRDADYVVLPLPATEDGVRIRAPMEASGLRFLSLLNELNSHAIIFGGKLPELWQVQAEGVGVQWYDYLQSERLQMRNALPTAEAALYLAMQLLPVTLDGCHVAVLGYGRVGSLLTEKLVAMGAEVTVYARKERDLAHAELRHCRAIPLVGCGKDSTLCDLPRNCRIVFNTIPQQIVGREVLECWRRDLFLMELASVPPGGFDTVAADELSFSLTIASALPGKHFPETAGRIVADTLLEWSGLSL